MRARNQRESAGPRQDGSDARSGSLWLFVVLALLVPTLAHLSFSALGFNPTDDGFVLAQARRVLDGEVPHRDFISIRPAGSAYLHVAEVALGGGRTYWLSRWVVWIELGLIAWAWIAIFWRARPGAFSFPAALGLGLAGFTLTAHSFPVMAWHTIDGLALLSLGALLASGGSAGARLAGWLLIGAAPLCKQSFLPAAIAAPLVLGATRDVRAWGALVLPGLLYGAALAGAGATRDAIAQLGAQTGFFSQGVLPLVSSPAVWAGLVVGLVAIVGARRLAPGADEPEAAASAGGGWVVAAVEGLLAALLIGALVAVAMGIWAGWPCFALFGLAAGCLIGARVAHGHGALTGAGGMALLAAWASSVSLGYVSPALGSAALVPLVFAARPGVGRPASAPRRVAPWVLGAAALAALSFARLQHVYLEPPAAQITKPLDGVLPGAAGIRTDANTYWFLDDLRRAVAAEAQMPFAIVPDVPGYWARAWQRNPLPIDWPQSTELATSALTDRVIAALDSRRGRLRVLVQKVEARPLAERFVRLRAARYPVVEHLQRHWTRVGETDFFDVYE